MQEQFEKYIESLGLKTSEHPSLLTVSGGRDSMCMCELFRNSSFPFAIAHCNFSLRGEDSARDEAFVRNYAEKNGITLFVKNFDTKGYAEEKNISIQMAARDLRYAWFDEIADREGYNYIATAHHLDDQTETFFINIIRGTGIAGLHGILPVKGSLIRPLLFATREEINFYIKDNNVAFREDGSNASVKYLRNKIRLEILPRFEEMEPDFTRKISETVELLRQGEQIIQKSLDDAYKTIVTEAEGMTLIDKYKLMCQHPSEYYLYHFVKPFGFNASQVNDIIDAITGHSGKQFFSQEYNLLVGRKELIINKKTVWEDSGFYLVEEDIEQITIPFCLEMKREKITPDTFVFPKGKNEICLDSSKIHFPLKIRKWQQGDYFFPLGMNNRKLLSDFFIDEKFELPQKADTWLLFSKRDIIWVVGHRIDNRYRITDGTEEIIRFFVKK